MFGSWQRQMTEASSHYLDWSRTGELLFSFTHKYSKEELAVRGAIVAFTALSGFLGAHLNDENKTYCSDVVVGLSASLTGFVVSHAVALIPVMQKRREMSRECEKIIAEIHQYAAKHWVDIDKLKQITTAIMRISLTTERSGNASLTWGRRKHVLVALYEGLMRGDFSQQFWQDDVSVIINNLENVKKANPRPSR